MDADRSRVLRFEGEGWRGVPPRRYKDREELFAGVLRHTLLAEGEAEPGLPFQVRYFEVQPGGFTTLERHRHPHAVVVLRGQGKVILGREVHEIAPFDAVYIAPKTLHQFHAAPDGPLGFLCVVPRERDRPQPASPEEIRALRRANPAIHHLLSRKKTRPGAEKTGEGKPDPHRPSSG